MNPAITDAMMKRALENPASVEAKIIGQAISQAAQQHQQMLRDKLQQMIELVPGQLFRDVSAFHSKFGVETTGHTAHELPPDVLEFRGNFLLEELLEYFEAVGLMVAFGEDGDLSTKHQLQSKFNAEKAFDGLIDLIYVALGNAYLHRFPFNDGWQRVHEANMKKVRASGSDDPRSTAKRKHVLNIVKPEGWEPPKLADLLGRQA